MTERLDRRQFLGWALGAGAALAWGCRLPRQTVGSISPRKLVLVVFGGGTRSRDTIDDPRHRFIPRLWNELVPRGTLFTNVRIEGKVVHPNSVGSLLTGHWEWDDIDWSRPVAHPTIFEIHRRRTGAADTQAWLFAYASILAKAGESQAAGFGAEWAANVVEPPTIPRAVADQMDQLLRSAAATGSPAAETRASADCAGLARAHSSIARHGLRSDAARAFLERQFALWKRGNGTTSHDAFLTESALACMDQFAPCVLVVAFGEIDSAHYGSWSRYTEAIERTDELTWRLWQAIQTLPAYRDRTLLLIAPDHGRELEENGGTGFIHHSDFYTNTGADEGCRRVWLLALGPDVPANRFQESPVPLTALAATGLRHLGHPASVGAARALRW